MDNSIQDLSQQFRKLLQSQQLSHAHLIECPLNKPVDDAISNIISLILCSSLSNCGHCQSCNLLANNAHPDLVHLSNSHQAIKVADIRELTQFIYKAPKLATYKTIVINAVDRLNRSAANALLKMLEEPPKQVVFILSCQNISQVIATIRSRSVQWYLPVSVVSDEDWNVLPKWLANDEGKMQLFTDKSMLIEHMNAVYEQKKHPCDIAQSWQQYPVYDLLWFLYMLHAWALRQNYSEHIQDSYFGDNELLLKQIHQIHAMIKLVNKGITLNNILMCETLLIGCRGIA